MAGQALVAVLDERKRLVNSRGPYSDSRVASKTRLQFGCDALEYPMILIAFLQGRVDPDSFANKVESIPLDVFLVGLTFVRMQT